MSERRQERKVVTVLFCDLVGFTQRAEEMDPEDVAALLGPYHARVKDELERYGGTVEKFIGDAVMAVFGAPVAHEDDPERAVRAALAIREYAEEQGIELRIGITTGEALVTLGARPDEGESMATGDVVNTAARLQAGAPVNGILVGEKTFEATRNAIDYRELEPVEAKGKARPIPAREALRARSRIALDRLHGTPLVGRERELDLLVDALARARTERQPQLVTLVGVPGIGKSRLVYELSQAADRDPELISWRQGRCLPYGEGVSFWALGEIVKAHLGILEADAAEHAESKLRAAVPDRWIQAHLRPLLGLALDGMGEADRREEAFTAWRRFIEAIAEHRPLALVIEDLHWADENLLDFVDHLVDWASGVALLVVCTARPELLERRPAWGGGKPNSLTISLSSLSDEETARLIAELLEQVLMPADTQASLIARAGGNPLYAEQYVRMLEERAGGDLPLPETVQGIIAARLDLLADEQKALLQDASVVGKVFWLDALRSISASAPRVVESSLHALEKKGFVRRERETSIEGDTEYAFPHVLVRDVAYGQIPRAARSEKHRLAAEWIESLGRREDHSEMLAHHYGEALALARAAGVETTGLQEPARRALRAAGDRAMALYAFSTALGYYERALELTPEAGSERSQLLFGRARAHFSAVDDTRVDLLEEAREALLAEGDRETAALAAMLQARALRVGGKLAAALELVRSGAALLANVRPSPATASVLADQARLLAVMGSPREGLEVARQALATAEELGLVELRASALHALGVARVVTDDLAGIDDLEESLGPTLEHCSPFEIARLYNNLAMASVDVGRVERASELFAAGVENSERFGLPPRWARGMAAMHAYSRGHWDQAARQLDEFLAAEGSSHLLEPSVRSTRAQMRIARDELEQAAADCGRALELVTPDVWQLEPQADVALACARLALAEGRPADAAELTRKALLALAGARAIWGPDYVEVTLLLVELGLPGDAVLEEAAARPDNQWRQLAAAVLRGELESAAERLAELHTPPLEAHVRLRAAESLVAKGRRGEGDVHVQKALAFWRSVGATRYIREAEALLAQPERSSSSPPSSR